MHEIDSNSYEIPQGEICDLAFVASLREAKAHFSRSGRYQQAAERNERHRDETRTRKRTERAAREPEIRRIAREKSALRSAAYRARKAVDAKAVPEAVKPEPLTRDALQIATGRLLAWLKQPGPRQRQIHAKGFRDRYLVAQRILLKQRHTLGAQPSPKAFAAALAPHASKVGRLDHMAARNLLLRLAVIEEEVGGWIESVTRRMRPPFGACRARIPG